VKGPRHARRSVCFGDFGVAAGAGTGIYVIGGPGLRTLFLLRAPKKADKRQ
jgi:hypothetical protein